MTVEQVDANQVVLTLPSAGSKESQASATVHLQGATVISWKVAQEERLFLSDKAVLDGSKAIRGGIPLVFPQFGKTTDTTHPYFGIPQHGFIRNTRWRQDLVVRDDAEVVSVQFVLLPSDLSDVNREAFPYSFRLLYLVTLSAEAGGSLHTKLTVINEEPADGGRSFEFNALFHTYFSVHDVANAEVLGLEGVDFYDKVGEGAPRDVDKNPTVRFPGEVDRIYLAVPGGEEAQTRVLIGDGLHAVAVRRSADTDVVVWNPGRERAVAMSDLSDKAYRQFVCAEVGHVRDYVTLKAGGSQWNGWQELFVTETAQNLDAKV